MKVFGLACGTSSCSIFESLRVLEMWFMSAGSDPLCACVAPALLVFDDGACTFNYESDCWPGSPASTEFFYL